MSAFKLALSCDNYCFLEDEAFFTDDGPMVASFSAFPVEVLPVWVLMPACFAWLLVTFLMELLKLPLPWRLVCFMTMSWTDSAALACFCVCDELCWDWFRSLDCLAMVLWF